MADSVSSASLDMEEEHLLDSIFAMDNTEVKLVSTCSVDRGVHDIGYPKGACCCIWCCRTPLGLLRNHSADGLCSFGKPAFLDWPDKVMTALSAPEFSRQDGKMRRCIVSCPTAMQMISLAPYCLSDSLLLFYIRKGLVPTPGLRQVSPFIANSVVFFELLTFFFDTIWYNCVCGSFHTTYMCQSPLQEYKWWIWFWWIQFSSGADASNHWQDHGCWSLCWGRYRFILHATWSGLKVSCRKPTKLFMKQSLKPRNYCKLFGICGICQTLQAQSDWCFIIMSLCFVNYAYEWKATFLALYQWQLLHLNPKVDGILYRVNVCWLTLG